MRAAGQSELQLFTEKSPVPRVYARVAVERAIDAADAAHGLTYAFHPAPDEPPLRVGERVEVPLARAKAAGFVVEVGGDELLRGLSPSRVRALLRRTGAGLDPPLVELARWIARYYVCPLGPTLASMLPAAVKRAAPARSRVELTRVDRARAAEILEREPLSPAARRAWEAIDALELTAPIPPRELAARLGRTSTAGLDRLVRAGLLIPLRREIINDADDWILSGVESRPRDPVHPTTAQRAIIDAIAATTGFAVHFLHGVTGSGKTEVYLRVLERVLDAGGSAIVLVPEIALTPQTAGRFVERFGASAGVAVLHSGLSAGARHRAWSAVGTGRARVVVGARSALFAPLPRLGLIVVDEEHDPGYKQDQAPRYHARDAAIKRAQIEDCPVILGSATPSLESWSNARAGRFRMWSLPARVVGGAGPTITVVDLAEERRAAAGQPRSNLIGPTLAGALARTLDAGGQAILLLNRRGFANYLCCARPACGWVLGCDQCDASMVLHRAPDRPRAAAAGTLRCHHCTAETLVPRVCPVCAGPLVPVGAGTQRLEAELERRFGALGLDDGRTLLRLDSDSLRTGKHWHDVLTRFARGEIRVLVGTQMIAKGLDFPNVQLVGVVNADTGLALPDFRAAERTFQLVSQVAGRAGRGPAGGLVVVQTMDPSSPAIRAAAAGDYHGFAEQELAIRRRAGLPPITRMARIVVRDLVADKAARRAKSLARWIEHASEDRVRIVGPAPCPIARLGRFHRIAIDLFADAAQDLVGVLSAVRAAGQLTSDTRAAVDVDPVALI